MVAAQTFTDGEDREGEIRGSDELVLLFLPRLIVILFLLLADCFLFLRAPVAQLFFFFPSDF